MSAPAQELCHYLREPQSDHSDSTRLLRTSILGFQARGKRCIIVTSSWEGEGKSTTCLNLAASLGELGKRTLLVDGDLRQRNLSALFGLHGPGLANSCTEISASGIPGVWVAPAGRLECNPAEVLIRPWVKRWLGEQRQRFDLVLIDCPPLSACGDALLWGVVSDGALFVTSRRRFRGIPEGHFCEDLRDAQIEVLGLVVNG